MYCLFMRDILTEPKKKKKETCNTIGTGFIKLLIQYTIRPHYSTAPTHIKKRNEDSLIQNKVV